MAQKEKEDSFTVVFMSNYIKYNQDVLEAEIRKKGSLAEVKEVLRTRVIEAKGKIVIMYRKGSYHYTWQKVWGNGIFSITDSRLITGRRGDRGLQIADMRNASLVLKDTIVSIDTLRVLLNSKGRKTTNLYKVEAFSGNFFKQVSPVIRDGVLLIYLRTKGEPYEFWECELLNNTSGAEVLARWILFEPSEETRKEWIEIARNIKKKKGDWNLRELSMMMQEYIEINYGWVSISEVHHFLKANI